MASTGKKGKKNKGTVISLQNFLANGDSPSGTTQVSKKIRNIDGDDSDDGSNTSQLTVQLPTAPRANRVFDDDAIPHRPPFIAYITNLPFDANEDDIHAFFGAIPIASLRLPREDGETGRVRGFGYVEFEARDDLIHVLSLPDPTIKGRRIRIEISNDSDQQNNKQRGNRRGYDGFGGASGENRDSTNWRRDNQNSESGGFGKNYDRNDRYRDRNSTRDDNDTPGSWRTAPRPIARDASPNFVRSRDGYQRNRNYDRENRAEAEPAVERPKLNLQPRTLPLPEIVTMPEESEKEKDNEVGDNEETAKPIKPTGVAPEKVFGSAKPVDTAARELEIEERLAETRRQEKLRREQEQVNEKLEEVHIEKTDKDNTNTSWRRRQEPQDNKHSPERNNDDRRKDNRDSDYNRYKNRDRNDRSDSSRIKQNQNRDGKHKEDKSKRDVKLERTLPKYTPNQSEPVLQTSNKYSGLDDEASD